MRKQTSCSWREGRAKAAKVTLYPNQLPGMRVTKPTKSGRKGIPVGLEPWVGGWQPSPESALLYPPPGMRAAKGLPGILAGNPKAPDTWPRLFILPGYHGSSSDSYMHLPLAHRLDIDKLFGLMKMCPEWDSISCHGSHGDRRKHKPLGSHAAL